MFNVCNRNTRKNCLKLTKAPKQRQWRRSGDGVLVSVFINFEDILHLFLEFLLLTLNK